MGQSQRRIHTRDFKLEVLRLILQAGLPLNVVAREFELQPSMVRRWKREYLADPQRAFAEQMTGSVDLAREVCRLKRENHVLRMRLSKAVAVLCPCSEPA